MNLNQIRLGEPWQSKEEMANGAQQETGMLMFTEATPSQTDGWVLPFPETITSPIQLPTSERKE